MVGSSSSSFSEDEDEAVSNSADPGSNLLDIGSCGDMNRGLAFSVLNVKGVTASMMHCVLIGNRAVPGGLALEYLPILPEVFIRLNGVISLAGDEA